MTNPEVEGLVAAVGAFLRDGTYVTVTNRGPTQVVRDAEYVELCDAYEAFKTRPLPDGEAGEREKVIAWNGGNVELLITGKWRVCDSASELARLIRGGARIEALRSLTTSEPRT